MLDEFTSSRLLCAVCCIGSGYLEDLGEREGLNAAIQVDIDELHIPFRILLDYLDQPDRFLLRAFIIDQSSSILRPLLTGGHLFKIVIKSRVVVLCDRFFCFDDL